MANAFDNTAGHDHTGAVAGDGAKISLTASVTGVLPVANGGTGSTGGFAGAMQVVPGGVTVGAVTTPLAGTGSLTLNGNTAAPPAGLTGQLAMYGPDGTGPTFALDCYNASAGAPSAAITFRRSRGTAAAPGPILNGDTILAINGLARGATSYSGAATAIFAQATENWSDTAHGTALAFSTTLAGGVASANSLILNGNTATFSGSVSLGTGLAAGSILTVSGGAGVAVLNLNSGHNWQIFTDTTGQYTVADSSASANRITITSAGSCAASSAWGIVSDVVLKDQIEDHPHGLAEILQLRPRRFRMVDDDRMATGLIAQELEAVMPELVGEMVVGEDGATVKTVTETGVIWPLINAIKTLNAEIEELKRRLGP